jgi:hypothetical protein
MDFIKQAEIALKLALKLAGIELVRTPAAIAAYAAQRVEHLATIVGEPGYARAFEAERNNVAMYSGLKLHDLAKVGDAQALGAIAGIMQMGALQIAGPSD